MKETISLIIEPISHIINQSFQTGIVPDDMKIAKVIPVHKSSDPSLLKIAFSKLLEKKQCI